MLELIEIPRSEVVVDEEAIADWSQVNNLNDPVELEYHSEVRSTGFSNIAFYFLRLCLRFNICFNKFPSLEIFKNSCFSSRLLADHLTDLIESIVGNKWLS